MAADSENWDFLIKRIEQGKCALVIGPEIAFSKEGKSFQESLYEHLDKELKGKNFEFFGEDEFISFDSTKDRLLTLFNIQTFLEKPRAQDLYQKLARIPFHLIINLSPDLYLRQAFKNQNLYCDFRYYNKSQHAGGGDFSNITINKDQPLIYNLMGNVEDEESLIFTYDDLFSYLENIFGNFKLPEKLRLSLKNMSSFVFIGVKFKKWYLRLLFRLLGLHSEDKLIDACVDQKTLPHEATNFYTRHFEITFIERTSEGFINTLYEKSKNILRQPSEVEAPKEDFDLLASIRQKIANNEIEASLEEMKLYCSDEERDRLVLLESRFNQVQVSLHKGNISHSVANMELNNVKDSVLALAKEISQPS